MEEPTGPAEGFRGFVRWAMTPPQSIAVYLACLFLVAGLSFYVGTLKPKKTVGLGLRRSPPPAEAVAEDPLRAFAGHIFESRKSEDRSHRSGLTRQSPLAPRPSAA